MGSTPSSIRPRTPWLWKPCGKLRITNDRITKDTAPSGRHLFFAFPGGYPNVGKSTFINSFAGRACAKTGNKPGVTKGKQWIRLNKNVELLDTPGILWPKFDDERVGTHLAYIGSVNDQILNLSELAFELVGFLTKEYPGVIKARYEVEENEPIEIINAVAISRSCLKKGGEADIDKAVAMIIDDFRSGKLGKISVEKPSDY